MFSYFLYVLCRAAAAARPNIKIIFIYLCKMQTPPPKKVIVLGDVMLDINYISVSPPERTAPESPSVGVYKINTINHILGGAANVALGFSNLGMDVYLYGCTGSDFYSNIIDNLIEKYDACGQGSISSCLYEDNSRPTTQKHRKFLNDVLITRFDVEETQPIGFVEKIKTSISSLLSNKTIDAIVFSDYNKGFLTPELCKFVIDEANKYGIYTFVDPKTRDCEKFRNCYFFKPNKAEAANICGGGKGGYGNLGSATDKHITGEEMAGEMMKIMRKKVNAKYFLITDGANGLFIGGGGGGGGGAAEEPAPASQKVFHYKHTEAIDVRDVTGAGDIVLVSFVATYLEKMDICLAAKVANYIGGKSVRVLGNYRIDIYNFRKIIEKFKQTIDPAQIRDCAAQDGLTVVFTNGCFDILHSAHLRLLNYAKSLGDILVVGLNTDKSIKRLKGESRPINCEEERCAILYELRGIVDHVILFDDDTPIDIIEKLRPDVLVKGGDYTPDTVVGREYAGRVDIFPYVEGRSTTNVIRAAGGGV
jgi:D-beta-D-heptose 7-phosphate kinase/D-beta-D-heptose 1-phosphate adenosyltransferase